MWGRQGASAWPFTQIYIYIYGKCSSHYIIIVVEFVFTFVLSLGLSTALKDAVTG